MKTLISHRVTLSDYGRVLASRQVGADLRRDIEHSAEHAQEGSLIVGLSGLEIISYSCADEALGKFLAGVKAGVYGHKMTLWLDGGSGDVLETIEAVLERRGLFVLHIAADQPRLVGHVPDYLADTLLAVLASPGARTGELADRIGLAPSALNNRLKLLWVSGVLERESNSVPHGGREFRYQIPIGDGG
jgi:hypothetical protein